MDKQASVFVKAFFLLDFHQDDVVSNLADTFPGDDKLAVSSEKGTEFSRPRHDQCCQAPCHTVELYIYGTPKAPAGTDINNFFLLQLTYAHKKPALQSAATP